MKTKKLVWGLIFTLFLGLSFGSAEDILGIRAKNAGGNGGYSWNYVAIDNNDNSFVIWTFEWSTTVFDTSLTSSGNKDIFVSKLDSNKNVIWVKKAWWPDIDNVSSITVDDDGYIYIAGSFTSEADLFGEFRLSTERFDSDFFLAKLDNDWNTIRVKTSTWPKNDYAKAVKVDSSGNIYVLWEFEGTASIFGINLTSDGAASDLFLTKLNSSGDAIRAKKSGNDKMDTAYDLVLDGNNIYVAWRFASTASIFGISLSTTERWDFDDFVAKLDSNGDAIRAKKWGNSVWESIKSLTVHNGNLYVVWDFQWTANLFGTWLTSNGQNDWYIVKLNSDGNPTMAKNVWWASNDSIISASLDLDGNIYLVGNFEWSVNFFGANISSNWWSDIFVSKISWVWSAIWTEKIWWTGNDSANFISLNNDFNVYVVGKFQWNANIFGSPLTASADVDLFLAKLLPFSSIVVIPNSTDINTIEAEFTSKWYTKTSNYLLWNRLISLKNTNGLIPNTINIKNSDINLNLPQNLQFKKADNTTNYTGIIEPPKSTSFSEVSEETVISSLSVGSSIESLKMQWWNATITVPTPWISIWESVNVYYSEDNWETWNLHTNGIVQDVDWSPKVLIDTNHFTDFAITLSPEQWGGEFSWSFTINNDDASTTSQNVTLNMSTSPEAHMMAFSNDGTNRSMRYDYSTWKSWTLSEWYGTKTVYVKFLDQDFQLMGWTISDTINYTDWSSWWSCIWWEWIACLNLEISAVDGYCQYGKNLDLWQRDQSYSAFVMSGDFLNISGSDSRYCDDRACKSAWTLDISASNLVTSGDNVFTIPNTAIEMFVATPQKYLWSSSFTFGTGDFANQWANLSTTKTVFEKTSAAGSVGKLWTDSVDLRVNVPANQAIWAYQSTITIQVPVMTI